MQSRLDFHRRQGNRMFVVVAVLVAILVPVLFLVIHDWYQGLGKQSAMDLSGTTNTEYRTRIIRVEPPR